MGFLDLFREKDTKSSIMNKLSKVIFDNGVTCANSLQSEIQENDKSNNEETYALRWMTVMMESIYFFLDQTNRIIFVNLNQHGMGAMSTLSNNLLHSVLDLVAEKYLYTYSEEKVENFKREMFHNMNKVKDIYINCKELYYEGDLVSSIVSNTTRRGFINQFTDDLSGVITGNRVSDDIVFNLKVCEIVTNLLGIHEIDDLIKRLDRLL